MLSASSGNCGTSVTVSDNCGTSVTVPGICDASVTVTKAAAAENTVTLGDCYVVASDSIPTTSCGRIESDDGGGENEGGSNGGGICDANNGVIPMESVPSSSSSTSSSSGLGGAAGVMSVEGTTTTGKEDLGPVSRDRCNTWPMRRPQLDINAQTSPLIHEQIPEEETDLCDSVDELSNGRLGTSSTAALMGSPESGSFSPGISSPVPCGPSSAGRTAATPSDASDSGIAAPNKKSTTRRNAWGNMSYADLITQAIVSSPEKRLTLSQVYEWMVQNVPYFRDKGDSNSSAGWKNSIRHNLSLHSRFMRIQNEGAGKSSWWVINPDAKPGRNPRRQRSATLETTTKIAMDKKRRGARKKVMEMRANAGGGTLHSAGSSIVGSQASVLSRELYAGEEDSSNFEPFRSRTQSNLSLSGSSSRVSPSMIENYENFDSFDFPPFVEAASAMPHDILDRTNEMNLNQSDSPAFHRPMANPMLNGTSATASSSLIAHIKSEPSSSRTETSVQPPPSYHELDVVRGVQNIQNPLLRTHLIQNRIPSQQGIPYNGSYSAGSASVGSSNWMHSNVIPINVHPSISCAAQQSFSGNTAALPMDLENLALPDQPLMEVENMEAVIRHELSQSAGSQLSFDNI